MAGTLLFLGSSLAGPSRARSPEAKDATMKLKADLHLHTSEGPERFVRLGARTLIDWAVQEGYRVLAITNHNTLTYSEALKEYAWERGILLIPGVEATVEGKHVLLYNFDYSPDRIRTFEDIRRWKGPQTLVIAPHPFFPLPASLGRRLLQELDLFDAVEFSHFYTNGIDCNQKAVKLAKAIGLPLVGTSDCHFPRQFGTTYSLIEVEEATLESVVVNVKKGNLDVFSRPLSLGEWVKIGVALNVRGGVEKVRELLDIGRGGDRRLARLSPAGTFQLREAQGPRAGS